MKEKRSSERHETFEYWTVTETSTGRHIGIAVDINHEGMRIHSKDIIKSGGLLHATIHLDKHIAGVDSINVDIRCRWCRKTRASELMAAGFAIVSPSAEFLKIEQKLVDFFSVAV